MGDDLSADDGVALLMNGFTCGAIFFVVISVVGPISGGHVNPLVSISCFLKQTMDFPTCFLYCLFQIGGGIVGCYVAHAMYMHRPNEFHGTERDTDGELFAEFVATFGLLVTIFGFLKTGANVASGVGVYLIAAFFFCSSTSFANPAVTIGRSFSDTFSSINSNSFKEYLIGELLGFVFALPASEWLIENRTPLEAVLTLVRLGPAPAVNAPTKKKMERSLDQENDPEEGRSDEQGRAMSIDHDDQETKA